MEIRLQLSSGQGGCVYYGVIGLHMWYTEDTQGDHY